MVKVVALREGSDRILQMAHCQTPQLSQEQTARLQQSLNMETILHPHYQTTQTLVPVEEEQGKLGSGRRSKRKIISVVGMV
jgi:hypothetical protein